MESQLANTQLNMRMVTNVAVVAVPVDSGSLYLLLRPMTQLESETTVWTDNNNNNDRLTAFDPGQPG